MKPNGLPQSCKNDAVIFTPNIEAIDKHISLAMKLKTHSHNGNGNAIDSYESSSPSLPRSPRHEFNISHCRWRLRSKSFSEMKKLGSFAAGIIGYWNLQYFFLLPMLYFFGLFMYVCPFLALIGRAPILGSVYPSHEIFQKLWLDVEVDNSTVEGRDTVATGCVEQGTIKVGEEVEILGLMQCARNIRSAMSKTNIYKYDFHEVQ